MKPTSLNERIHHPKPMLKKHPATRNNIEDRKTMDSDPDVNVCGFTDLNIGLLEDDESTEIRATLNLGELISIKSCEKRPYGLKERAMIEEEMNMRHLYSKCADPSCNRSRNSCSFGISIGLKKETRHSCPAESLEVPIRPQNPQCFDPLFIERAKERKLTIDLYCSVESCDDGIASEQAIGSTQSVHCNIANFAESAS